MGLVKNILGFKNIDEISTLYSDHLSLELAEDFHIHYRNTRMEFDDAEWEKFSKSVIKAYGRWRILGKPKIGDINHEGRQIFLCQSHIEAEPGKKNQAIKSNELRVELQKWTDYVHLHYKWFRLEFSVDEFLEFANTITDAKEKLLKEEDLDKIPRRTGKFHVACPRGNVDNRESDCFWIDKNDDDHLDHRHKTIFFNEDDIHRNEERDQGLKQLKNSKLSNFLYNIFDKSSILSRIFGIRIS